MLYNKDSMKVIFAQGNPGSQYAASRHNLGFIMLDLLAKKWGTDFIKKPKFHADIAEMTIKGQKILLVKPATFYNETGHSARLLVDFYKLDPATDFLVVYDDFALPFGTIRTREKGSDAGNNGVKSLNAHLGQQYGRIRIGIFNEKRHLMDDADFVLGHLSTHEKKALPAVFQQTEHFVEDFIQNNFKSTKVTVPSEIVS
jgi:peptidyl-tRNA hydrolase, PTH1 family